FFFFSSRRRHTRWPRDWSSDVCSSDLVGNRLAQHHVERTHPVARHEQQRLAIHLVDLADFATAEQREGKGAGDERKRHTVTSAAAAAGATASTRWSTAGSTCSRNSSTWRGARPT